jgi:N6-adenosine-specific RNA methylase IME4
MKTCSVDLVKHFSPELLCQLMPEVALADAPPIVLPKPASEPHPAFPGLLRNHYRVILADPPWKFIAGEKGRPQHYSRLTKDELLKLPVSELAHPDGCWLFLWSKSPHTPQAFELARAWGFEFSGRAFVWVKLKKSIVEPPFIYELNDALHTGMGFTTRKNAEDVWLFKIGRSPRAAKDVREIMPWVAHENEAVFEPRREHSRKPEAVYRRIERLACGPRAELFARQRREDWDGWGLELGKFDDDMFSHEV